MSQYATIIDIGGSKIIVLICSAAENNRIVVHGADVREYSGYRDGRINDEQDFIDAVSEAVKAAQTEAKRRIKQISVGVPAPFLKCVIGRGSIEIRSKTGRVTDRELERLMQDSLKHTAPEGYELIHSSPVEFLVDGIPRQDVPFNIEVKTMQAAISHVYVSSYFKKTVASALSREGLLPDMFVGTPLSECMFLISEQDRSGMAALIDVGYNHTDISLIRGTALLGFKVVNIGGVHFSGDLEYGLQLPPQVAENIKRRYVYSLDYLDNIDYIRIPGGTSIKVDHEVIQYIIESRARELAGLIEDAVRELGVDIRSIPVYLTGGGITLMRGSCEFLEKILGTTIQVHMPWMPRLSSPNYASAFSVMDFAMHAQNEDATEVVQGKNIKPSFFRKIISFFLK